MLIFKISLLKSYLENPTKEHKHLAGRLTWTIGTHYFATSHGSRVSYCQDASSNWIHSRGQVTVLCWCESQTLCSVISAKPLAPDLDAWLHSWGRLNSWGRPFFCQLRVSPYWPGPFISSELFCGWEVMPPQQDSEKPMLLGELPENEQKAKMRNL